MRDEQQRDSRDVPQGPAPCCCCATGKGDVRPCVAVLSPVRCSLLLLVRPAEEMCGEEAAPPTGRRREASGEEDATGGEMCLAEGVKR